MFRETSRGRRGSDSSIDDDIDDDDDTFQILTAESLFSTLLSRVCVIVFVFVNFVEQ